MVRRCFNLGDGFSLFTDLRSKKRLYGLSLLLGLPTNSKLIGLNSIVYSYSSVLNDASFLIVFKKNDGVIPKLFLKALIKVVFDL